MNEPDWIGLLAAQKQKLNYGPVWARTRKGDSKTRNPQRGLQSAESKMQVVRGVVRGDNPRNSPRVVRGRVRG